MANETNSGYDMKDTLRWYAKNIQGPIFQKDAKPKKNYPIENHELAQIHDLDILRTIGLFPENAIDRSILDKIIWEKPKWFAKASLETGIPIPTIYESDAISPTAIIPGKTNYYLDKDGKLRASIELYGFGGNIANWEIRRTVHTEALAHEFAHTIIAPALYGEQKLKLPSGEIVEGHDFVMDIGRKAEAHTPVSNYASAYRAKNIPKEVLDNGSGIIPYRYIDGDLKTAVSEELVETIAQIVLPFALHNEKGLSKEQNLANRLDVISGLEAFLNAEGIR